MSSRVSWFQSWWKWRASDQQTLWISSIRRDSAACFLVVGEYNSRVESTSHFLWYFYSLIMISRMSTGTCFRDERRSTLLTSTQGIPGWGVKSRNVVTLDYSQAFKFNWQFCYPGPWSGIWDPWDLYDILHEEQINDFPKKIKIKKRIYPSWSSQFLCYWL